TADYQPSFVQCLTAGDHGCMVFGFQATGVAGGSPQIVFGAGLKSDGSIAWSNQPCSIVDAKARLASAMSPRGFAMLAFGNGPTGGADILAQNVWPDGSFGAPTCAGDADHNGTVDTADLTAFLNTWFVSLQAHDLGGDFNHDGRTDTADITDFFN